MSKFDPSHVMTGQQTADHKQLFAQLQRRAMTPTPRQERLSSTRTTDDDLDYRSVLARSAGREDLPLT